MRNVYLSIAGDPTGEQRTWAYPKGQSLGEFLVPVYSCYVRGVDAKGNAVREQFDVLRFGVQSKDGMTARVVGLADYQRYIIKAWLPKYRVHSAASSENGAWRVYDNFLIHDGPDDPTELFATIGCIEVMGPSGFVKFNDLIISLAGPKATNRPQQLAEIGRARRLSVTYEKAVRPPLKKAP
jgi:hypothetical protein